MCLHPMNTFLLHHWLRYASNNQAFSFVNFINTTPTYMVVSSITSILGLESFWGFSFFGNTWSS